LQPAVTLPVGAGFLQEKFAEEGVEAIPASLQRNQKQVAPFQGGKQPGRILPLQQGVAEGGIHLPGNRRPAEEAAFLGIQVAQDLLGQVGIDSVGRAGEAG